MPYSDIKKQRAAQRAWALKNRSENPQLHANRHRHRRREAFKFIKEKKESEPCKDCGVRYPYFVMQFDHVSGDKKFNVSTMACGGYTIQSIQEEIDKCEVVCANCHASRTFTRKVFPHGLEP